MAPPEIVNGVEVRLNLAVLAAGLALTVVATLMAGLIPALRASGVTLAHALKDGGGTGQGRSSARLRRGMVVAELAFSLTLLVAAGLAVRGVQRQLAADPGFDAGPLVSFTVRLPASRYADDAAVDLFYDQAVDRLEQLPAVEAATSNSRLPLGAGGLSLGRSFIFDGAVTPPDGPEFGASWVEVDPEFFTTLQVRPVEGRAFTSQDGVGDPFVAIVNERMARLMSPGEPILGRSIRSFYDENVPRTVIGIVPDLQYNGVSRSLASPLVFVPRAQSVRSAMVFLVRTTGDPTAAIPEIRAAMVSLDPDIALDRIQSLRRAHASDLGGIRFLTVLFSAFGGLALVLAISGVYGVVAFSVTQRTREFGLRLAVGADSATLTAGIVQESAKLIALGLAIGMVLAYGAGRILENGMDGVAVMQVSTFAVVGGLLGGAVLIASWLPAVRATQVDPMRALRTD